MINRCRLGILALGLLVPIMAFAQKVPTDAEIVDSLFIRASSGLVMFRDEAEPSKKALITMGERAIPEMLTKLDTRSAGEMLAITDIFKGIGEPAVEPLTKKLKSPDDYVRRLAVRCLGEIKSPKAVDYLAPYAASDDFRTRSGVMDALGLIGDAKSAPYVMKGIFDSDELVAYPAAVACGRIKKGIDPVALTKVINHPYYGVRYCAMQALVELGNPAVGPLKQYLVAHPADIGAGYAIEALGRIGSGDAIAPLGETMKSPDWNIRTYTAGALGYSKNKTAIKILKKALKSETHPLVINNIKSALSKLQSGQ